MGLKPLRCFVAVAEDLHFARAAERLGVDQSLLSRQVKALEREVGMRVLWRTTRKTTLTVEGQRVFDEAIRVLEVVDGIRRQTNHNGTKCHLEGLIFYSLQKPSAILRNGPFS